MKRTFTCIICPNSCEITVTYTSREDAVVEGNRCKRGIAYSLDECFDPKRVFTSSVRIEDGFRRMLPVRRRHREGLSGDRDGPGGFHDDRRGGALMYQTDVLIIGAGAVGVALAREFSKYKVDVLVCDKNDDVGGEASKSNSGLTSTSATMTPGTLECRLRTISHSMIDVLCRELDVPISHCGSIAPVVYPEQLEVVPNLLEKAFQNGVYDYEFKHTGTGNALFSRKIGTCLLVKLCKTLSNFFVI